MTVYVLMLETFGAEEVIGVFSTEENAQKRRNGFPKSSILYIVPYTLDEMD